jgi:GTP-binding protein
LHLVDGTSDSIDEDYLTIREELKTYGAGLAEKETILALNKCDALSEDEIAKKKAQLEEVSGGNVMNLSGVSGAGTIEILRQARSIIEECRRAPEEEKVFAP